MICLNFKKFLHIISPIFSKLTRKSYKNSQYEVSDQIRNKRSDQMYKSEFKNDPTFLKKN